MEQPFTSGQIGSPANVVTGHTDQSTVTASSLHQPLPLHHKKNIYPLVRHAILIACVLLAFFIVVFLIHQNGKSIYDNGV